MVGLLLGGLFDFIVSQGPNILTLDLDFGLDNKTKICHLYVQFSHEAKATCVGNGCSK